MPRSPTRSCLALIWVCAVGSIAWLPATSHERAVELLVRLSGAPVRPDQAAPQEAARRDVTISASGGPIRARLYEPATPLGRTLVVAHGIHHRGIDEPRLIRFCSELGRLGFHVLSPEIRDLTDYRVTEPALETVVETVKYAGSRPELSGSGKVGLVGISFGGGLSLVAATRADVAPHLDYVASIGGHHDLGRVLRFFFENRIATPAGSIPLEAHEYGIAVVVYGALEALSPPEDVDALRIVFRHWLMEDRELARRQAGAIQTERGRKLFALLESGGLGSVAGEMNQWLEDRRDALVALSPSGRLAQVSVPIYLLHGKTDRVIPPSELAWAARELEGRPHAALVTSLIEHVMPDRPAGIMEKLLLVEAVSKLL